MFKNQVAKQTVNFSFIRYLELIIKSIKLIKKIDSGIDKIKSKEELIQKFNNCISRAYNEIPDNRKYRTNILLGATGGLRLLE